MIGCAHNIGRNDRFIGRNQRKFFPFRETSKPPANCDNFYKNIINRHKWKVK